MSLRINKYIAAAGICSRREADRMIAEGRVSINGAVVLLGQTVGDDDTVSIDGVIVSKQRPPLRVLAFNKPVGVTCTAKDPHSDLIISDIITYPVRLTYAGRLDRDSEGLLLLTNDGMLIEKMMRGSHAHEKEYVVRIDRELTAAMIAKMEVGIYLKDLRITTRPCQITPLSEDTFVIVLTQGVNRQIRRMCAACDANVITLKRTRVLSIELGELKSGDYRTVEGEELKELYRYCGMDENEAVME
ncbi:MAG: rRNA pseudouridine synthase [Lachnospiraceae bacterium]|jgi:23S rRNA pseudouridine2604 synthase|nr:rRNA pseudouridine synthase [Lachnospiraceae bacterium]